jgi:hypothetical protein
VKGAPAEEPRYIHLRIVLAEPVTEPLHEAAGVIFDTETAKSVRAVLGDNGYGVAECEVITGADARGWPMWAQQLAELANEVAQAQRAATVTHAEAYLAAEGTQQARAASADLAAADAVAAHATLAGRAEAFRLVLADRARRDAHSAPDGGVV